MRCRAVIDRLTTEGLLAAGWATAQAAELFWSMTSLRAWEDLVCRAGWSSCEWVQRTTTALEATLVASDNNGAATTPHQTGRRDVAIP